VGVGMPAAWAGVGLMGRLAKGVLLCTGGSPGECLPSGSRFSNTAELYLSKHFESLRSRLSKEELKQKI
jgi:hypothetical protein